MERQIAFYRGADADEIAYFLVNATYVRLALERQGVLLRQCLDLSLGRGPEVAVVQHQLSRFTRRAQRHGYFALAGGLLVWLHSVRALNIPDLRGLGRTHWSELSRGFPHVEEAIQRFDVLGKAELALPMPHK